MVDDDKVAEGLKKLRSLDEPLGPTSGMTQRSVVDASSADVTRAVTRPLTPGSGNPVLGARAGTPPPISVPAAAPSPSVPFAARPAAPAAGRDQGERPRALSPRSGTKTLMWSPTTPPPDSQKSSGHQLGMSVPDPFGTGTQAPFASVPAAPTPTPTPAQPPSSAGMGGTASPNINSNTMIGTSARPAPTPAPVPAQPPADDRKRAPAPTFVSSSTRATPTAHAIPPLLPSTATSSGVISPSLFDRPTPQAPVPTAPATSRSIPTAQRILPPPPVIEFEDDTRSDAPRVPRGTAVGRSVSGGAVIPTLPDPVDDRAYKGTLHGHSLHLPDLPEPGDEVQPATVLTAPSATTAGQMPAMIPDADFATSRETGPFNKEQRLFRGQTLFPEAEPYQGPSTSASPALEKVGGRFRKRGKFFASASVFVAVVATFVIVAAFWARLRHAEVAPSPGTLTQQKADPAGLAVPAGAAPSAAAPSAAADPTGAAVPGTNAAPVPAESARTPAAEVYRPAAAGAEAVEAPPKRIGATPPLRPVPIDPYAERPTRIEKAATHAEGKPGERSRRRSSAVEPPPRTARPAPAAVTPKPAHPSKRNEEDPDGTLPPTD